MTFPVVPFRLLLLASPLRMCAGALTCPHEIRVEPRLGLRLSTGSTGNDERNPVEGQKDRQVSRLRVSTASLDRRLHSPTQSTSGMPPNTPQPVQMKPDEPDDSLSVALSACLAQLAAGDLSARDRIIELCSERLRTLAHRMLARFPNVRRWEDTDDVFQNAAMRLHRSLGQMKLEPPRSVMAIAATHLHRELIDLARHHSGPTAYAANHGTNAMPGRGADGAEKWFIDQALAPEQDLARWTLFHESIDGLPADHREIFHLVWYLGADQKTISQLLDCSERTVKTRWREAREAVKAFLAGSTPE